MRKLPIGIQSFEKLRQDNYSYVDKTKYIWNLVHEGTVYFLSRPRRFGKSLLLSTMEAYFEGKKELFKGLEIEKLENDSDEPWTEYPIIHMSFATGNYSNENELENSIDGILTDYSDKYHITLLQKTNGGRLCELIEKISTMTGKNVVILIDEYDKPLLENLAVNEQLEDKNRKTLKGFYGALKDADEYLKFVFITGVTKFSKVSIFSDLNQLNDISLNPKFSGICGIAEDEMAGSFEPEIKALSEKMDITFDECVERLRTYYDGYHFSDSGVGVYNPFSLLHAFFDMRIGMYWFSTGTPTFLVNEMKKNDYSLQDLSEGVDEDADIMSSTFYDEFDFVQLLYQSGYLTITGFDGENGFYKLGFPNHEVEYGFEKSLIPYVLSGNPNRRIMLIDKMLGELRDGDIDTFMTEMKSLFASIPYPEGQEPSLEREWRKQMYLIFKLMGQRVSAEVHSSIGRCDAVVEMSDAIYVFEFKQDKTIDEALSQIDEKGYATPFLSDGKRIIKIGANFSTELRTIDEWKVVEN